MGFETATWETVAREQLEAIRSYHAAVGNFLEPKATAEYIEEEIDEIAIDKHARTSDTLRYWDARWLTVGANAWEYAFIPSTRMLDLLVSKQRDYGHGNIAKFGHQGIVVRASDKAQRLLNMINEDGTYRAAQNESVLDTWRDLVGYAVIARMWVAGTFMLPLSAAGAA